MGRNTWIKQLREEDGDKLQDSTSYPLSAEQDVNEPRRINIGGKATILMGKGDRLLIETPGGGAWGRAENSNAESKGGAGILGATKEILSWAARGSLAERAMAQAEF